MGNPAGVPRDFEALEKRRFQAIQMLQRGLRQAEIARQLRVVPQTVARWVHDYRTHGKSALRKAGRAGRMPRLSEKQRQQLEKLLVAGPEQIGYETPLWTCPRVADLIEQEFLRASESGTDILYIRMMRNPDVFTTLRRFGLGSPIAPVVQPSQSRMRRT